MDYAIYIITLVAIYCLVSLAYAIPLGYTGLLNLGHMGLFGVGAYAGAILLGQGIPFGVALILASLATGAIGFLLALPTRRIKGDYYALMTLGFTFVVYAVVLNWTGLTGGPFGISGIPRPQFFGSPPLFLFLTFFILLAASLFVRRALNSPFGRALEAVRDDELVAESLGKPTAKLKLIALTLSAFLVGVAGVLLASFLQFINIQVFWLDNAVFILAAVVVGGLASFPGAFLGTAILFTLIESMRFLALPPGLVGPVRLLAFSTLLLFVMLFAPKGIMGRAQLGE